MNSKRTLKPGQIVLSYDDLKKKGIRFSRQWILSLSQRGKFPKPIKLGEASTGFIESEVDDWIAGLIQQRDEAV
jgi:prophage regulatory protein